MEPIRKITDELAIAGQIDLEQLPELAEAGFQTVVNLRSPYEAGFMVNEQEAAEQAGLRYVNLPMTADTIDAAALSYLLQQLNELPRPILIHCDLSLRSAAIALAHIATRQGISLEQTLEQSRRLGLFSGSSA